MVNPGVSQPADRSGSASLPTTDQAIATTHSDNEVPATLVVTQAEKAALSSPSPNDQCPTPATYNAAQQPAVCPILQPLQIHTGLAANDHTMTSATDRDACVHHSRSAGSLPQRTPSIRALAPGSSASAASSSPGSVLPSPQLVAMGDITPLPSPIGGPSSWRLSRVDSQSLSRTSSTGSRPGSGLGLRVSESSQMLGSTRSFSRSKQYAGLDRLGEEFSGTPSKVRGDAPNHARNRSLSEYVPPARSVLAGPRPVAVSGSAALGGIASSSSTDSKSHDLHREQYLAVRRGIASITDRPPTPPRSSRGSDGENDHEPVIEHTPDMGPPKETYSVRSVQTQQPRKYHKISQLGQGTFSHVILAVRIEPGTGNDANGSSHLDGTASAAQRLVAIKIVEHGPAGGADEERLEVSLKREVEILKSVNHPSLVQLKAFGCDDKRALLVLDYCPGGDLFEIASSKPRPMRPELTRRIFAELVAAVRYLHGHFIVHRDIKLESESAVVPLPDTNTDCFPDVLVTVRAASMEKITDWRTYDRAVVTLSDLGLSRRIPQPPESPLLRTRCGSEDYAAPELLMGQPYDGRSTDAWALGVLLYAMMENRLPFDVLPGTRGDPNKLRARTPHRIARCEWSWYRYADADGEWDPKKGIGMEGARDCVESLLRRNTKRTSLDDIAAMPWVRDAMDVPDGLKRADKEVP
jgi:protein-serine/threonine kinase